MFECADSRNEVWCVSDVIRDGGRETRGMGDGKYGRRETGNGGQETGDGKHGRRETGDRKREIRETWETGNQNREIED